MAWTFFEENRVCTHSFGFIVFDFCELDLEVELSEEWGKLDYRPLDRTAVLRDAAHARSS